MENLLSTDKQDQLPSNWVVTELGTVSQLSSGGTPSRSNEEYWKGPIPWVKIGDIPEDGIVKKTEESITALGLSNSSAKIFTKGTILFTIFATIGKVGVLEIEAATNQAICGIRPFNGVDPSFLFYYLRYAGKQLERKTHGITQSNINMTIAKKLPIYLPPTTEQKRIVTKIEDLFAERKTALEALDKVPKLLKSFRRSILFNAFNGELVQHSPEDEPAYKLLERTKPEGQNSLQIDYNKKENIECEKFEKREVDSLLELPKNWIWSNIGELTESTFYGPRFAKSQYSVIGAMTIRTTDMDDEGHIILQNPPKIAVDPKKIDAYKVQVDDLLITRSGSIGKCAIFVDTKACAIPSAYLIRLRLNKKKVLPKYVLNYLLSYQGQTLLLGNATAVTQSNINAQKIRRFPIPLAPLAEQYRIVTKIDELLIFANQIKSFVSIGIEKAESINQSILTKAFRGELVPQDPSDEPASVLLQRIKGEA